MQSQPTVLEWDRPGNIPLDVAINYTVVVNSTTSNITDGANLSDQTRRFSIGNLEQQLASAEDCQLFTFHVVASVPFADNSIAAVVMDTIPLCK
jgi:hypothetical protein